MTTNYEPEYMTPEEEYEDSFEMIRGSVGSLVKHWIESSNVTVAHVANLANMTEAAVLRVIRCRDYSVTELFKVLGAIGAEVTITTKKPSFHSKFRPRKYPPK